MGMVLQPRGLLWGMFGIILSVVVGHTLYSGGGWSKVVVVQKAASRFLMVVLSVFLTLVLGPDGCPASWSELLCTSRW